MIKLKQLLIESKYKIYHNSYTSAVNSALDYANNQGYEHDSDETATKIGMGPRKPSSGKTNRFTISLTKNGVPQRKALHIQIYNRGTSGNEYELNTYIS
jgi:hypothetical protein